MYDFTYHRVDSLAEAAAALSAAEDGLLLAGGMTVIPTLKQRLAQPSDIIDIAGIAGLDRIEDNGSTVEIGALATHASVAASPVVRAAVPGLAGLAGQIGDPQVRHCGTLGGSLANNDPAADYPAAVLGLGATVVTDRREIQGDDFFTDLFETALEEGEIVTAVRFPKCARAAYMKFPNPASRYAMAGAFVAHLSDGPRVAVTGAAPCVFRWSEAEAALALDFRAEALADLPCERDDWLSDIHAAADYRAHLVTVMAKRAVAMAVEG